MTFKYYIFLLCLFYYVSICQLKRPKFIIVPIIRLSFNSSEEEPLIDTIRKHAEIARAVKIRRPKIIRPADPTTTSKQRTQDDDAEADVVKSDEVAYDTDELYNKIVGGAEVDIHLYPYHAAYGTNCGAAIIGKYWAITAGHCSKKPFIRVGSKYLGSGKKVLVKNNFIHPGWTETTKEHPFDFDFQLLELSEPLKFDSDNIQPIKIAHMEDMTIGKIVTVTGWGNTVENGPYSTVLRAVRVPIISKTDCQKVQFPYFRGTLTARMFCAGFSEGKKDACQGDSGGPAVSGDRLVGMVSFGYGCATPGAYGVYSKVAKVRDWIERTTGLVLD